MPSRKPEVDLALRAIIDGRGGYVWTGEPGSGKSTLLEAVMAEAALAASTNQSLSVRIARIGAPTHSGDLSQRISAPDGAAFDDLASQFFSETADTAADVDSSSLPSLSTPDQDARAPAASQCATIAGRFARDFQAEHPRAVCVMIVDDFDRLDTLSKDVLTHLAAQRQAPVVLLASAEEHLDERTLPYPIAIRRLTAASPADVLHMLSAERSDPTAPIVAATLAHLLNGNAAAAVQTARELSQEQLRGLSMLPDPLPVVPALHMIHGQTLAHLNESERRLLLLAAVAVVDRTEVLLKAADLDMDDILVGPVAEHLHFVGGRFAFPDPRLRALVHGTASLADRTLAHIAMAKAHTSADGVDTPAATWHLALGTLAGDPALAPRLLTIAASLGARGELERAQRVAREALSQGGSDIRAQAQAVAGTAAIGSGFVVDAVDSLRQAMRLGDFDLQSRTLAAYVEALCLYEGLVPDDAIHRHVVAARSGHPTAAQLRDVIRGLCSAVRLHCERGEGTLAYERLTDARSLFKQLQAMPTAYGYIPGAEADAVVRAQLALTLAEACASVYGITNDVDDWHSPQSSFASPDAYGLTASFRALALVLNGHPEEASSAITDAIAAVTPLDGDHPWHAGADASASPLVEAYLVVSLALVDFWSGQLTRATRTLVDAAARLPITLPFAGIALALLSRLAALGQESAKPLARAMSDIGTAPLSRPVRFGLLVDRALMATFAGRRTEASALLELAGEQDLPTSARFLPIPGLGEVEAWLYANQPESARRTLTRLRADVAVRADHSRRLALLRAEAALADLSDPAVYEAAVNAVRGLPSPYERARIELVIGRNLVRAGNQITGHMHLMTAAELFDRAGAPAWTKVVQADLSRVLEDALEVTERAAAEQSRTSAPAADAAHTAHSDSPLFAPTAPGENTAIEASLARWEAVLTEREFDVATLVAQGRSNREVAETLFLSIRTIEVHLGRVFRKLGVSSRLELAVLAHRK